MNQANQFGARMPLQGGFPQQGFQQQAFPQQSPQGFMQQSPQGFAQQAQPFGNQAGFGQATQQQAFNPMQANPMGQPMNNMGKSTSLSLNQFTKC